MALKVLLATQAIAIQRASTLLAAIVSSAS